ncbi:MAG: glycoside hydrolase/phage tail family protein [Amaricoccus sp.]
MPGTGEYVLATEPVYLRRGRGDNPVLNVHNDRGIPDLSASLDQLAAELPAVRSVSLVITWFGDDLRCGECRLEPAVEQRDEDGDPMRWTVSGVERAEAKVVSRLDGRPTFGGTPADASVLQAIARMKADGLGVMFYPFVLMDILAGNGLPDPWTGAVGQPPVPWRGRITLAAAPGRAGSSDLTAVAADEVAAFFGQAAAGDFEVAGANVRYVGPEEWSYRRFVLHYAHLCALAGGVDAFCIGSELRGLTQIRDGRTGYPAVRALVALAADVRAILGPGTKIGYAADWSEYFGHHPADGSNDVVFNLDPLWASPAIDFVGIDNYVPLSDWRDEAGHADAAAGSIYDLGYLRGNVAGGEGFDWYYADAEARDAQDRRPIADGAYGEDWVFRYKDLVGWWSHPHVDRVGGVKATAPTAWVPRSKPIWFTELGCPAVDKGTNQPNVFYDPKSSESFLPYYSSGGRDDFMQHRYLQATFAHWNDADNNPESDLYAGRMVDMSRAHVWAWDARPWPDFPGRIETWVDGSNYERGHWLNGRSSMMALAEIVAAICARCGVDDVDLARLHGGVTGYLVDSVESGRQSLQPLMLAYAFDSHAVDGRLAFASRSGDAATAVEQGGFVAKGREPPVSLTRAPAAEMADRVSVGFLRADLDYQAGAVDALAPEAAEPRTDQMSLPIVLFEGEARAIAERSLSEGRVARDSIEFALPPSLLRMTPGDLVSYVDGASQTLFRIDRIEEGGARAVSGVRVEPGVYRAPVLETSAARAPVIEAPGPVDAELLDLPLLGDEGEGFGPYVAVAKTPWMGPVAVYTAAEDFGYSPAATIQRPAVLGRLLDPLPAGTPGLWMRGKVRVRIGSGTLQGRTETEVLDGANAAALRSPVGGDWEVVQFQGAELVAPREYRLSGLLRGQAGTDASMPAVWPAGTDFVLLDGLGGRLSLPSASRGVARHYRIGPADRPYGDPSYLHRVEAIEGAALRPYRPTHLAARELADGGIELAWIRRTRIDGDSWLGTEVPLGEEGEIYLVRAFTSGGSLLREITTVTPRFVYSLADQVLDGATAALAFEVAQVSARFGAGPFERIEFNG